MSKSTKTSANSPAPDLPQMELFPTGSLPAGPAKTSALRARDLAWTAHARDYGRKLPVWLASFDREACCWRTAQTSLASTGELTLAAFSGTWPRSGSMRNGTAYQQPPLTHPTSVIASGSSQWLPTITANEDSFRLQGDSQQSKCLTALAKKGLLPTPRTTDGDRGGRGELLHTVKGAETPRGMLPTPTASRRSGLQSHGQNVILGSLNPEWTEWLQGLPIKWTEYAPSETSTRRSSRKR
jgi:hypothetical protein